jgi:NagD protein
MYFIDVQGTLISDIDKTPIDGAIEFIDTLNFKNIPYLIITNNTKQNSEEFLDFLNKSGFKISSKNYLDPIMVLKKELKLSKIAPYGHDEFIKVLKELDYKIDFHTPQAVVIGIKKDFMPDDYAQMIEFIISGAKLIAMHKSTLYAKNNKRYPGVGAIAKMLSFATGADCEIIGKPSIGFYNWAKTLLGAKEFGDITIISDDVMGDLVGAKELGMKSVFVLSGKYKTQEEILPKINNALWPDYIYKSIKEVAI